MSAKKITICSVLLILGFSSSSWAWTFYLNLPTNHDNYYSYRAPRRDCRVVREYRSDYRSIDIDRRGSSAPRYLYNRNEFAPLYSSPDQSQRVIVTQRNSSTVEYNCDRFPSRRSYYTPNWYESSVRNRYNRNRYYQQPRESVRIVISSKKKHHHHHHKKFTWKRLILKFKFKN